MNTSNRADNEGDSPTPPQSTLHTANRTMFRRKQAASRKDQIEDSNVPPLHWYFGKLSMVKEQDRDSVVELTDSDEEEEEDLRPPPYSRSIDPFHQRCSCNHLHDEEVVVEQKDVDKSLAASQSCELLLCDDNTSDLTCSPVRPASSQSTLSLSDSPNSFRALSDTNDDDHHQPTHELAMPKSLDKEEGSASFLPKSCVPSQPWPVSPTAHMIRTSLSHLTRLQDFNVVSLSHGFFAQVFKVIHFATKKVMVLKMNKEMSNRGNALKEIELLNKLNHRNIVAFMGTVVHGGTLHPLLEYINGGTLEQLVAQFYLTDTVGRPPLGVWTVDTVPYNTNFQQTVPIKRDAISARVHLLKDCGHTFHRLAADVARGMDYLHSQGYMHRDLASKNIFIRKLSPKQQQPTTTITTTSTDPVQAADIDAYLEDYFDDDRLEAVIGDFGFAIGEPALDGPKLSAVGSPYWMAPECFGKEWYNHKCDIYSFGVVCCELNWRTPADPDYLPRIDGNFVIDFGKLPSTQMDTTLAKVARLACKLQPSERPEFGELLAMFEKELNPSVNDNTEESTCFDGSDIFDQHLRRRFSTGGSASKSCVP